MKNEPGGIEILTFPILTPKLLLTMYVNVFRIPTFTLLSPSFFPHLVSFRKWKYLCQNRVRISDGLLRASALIFFVSLPHHHTLLLDIFSVAQVSGGQQFIEASCFASCIWNIS